MEGKKEDIEKAILDYIGILGWAKASPVFVKDIKNQFDKKTVLAVNRKELDNVRAALEVSNFNIKILRISGTLKGLGT